jgi:cupin fold WbuC family metalloprotein
MIAWELSGADSYYAYVNDQNLTAELIDALYRQGKTSPTGRARLCFHDHPSSPLHIMLIYHDERTIVPIHRHLPFGEFVIVRNGAVELIFFDENFDETSRTYMGPSDNENFLCFTPPNVWHSLHFRTPTIFFELSQGPLDAKTTEFAIGA